MLGTESSDYLYKKNPIKLLEMPKFTINGKSYMNPFITGLFYILEISEETNVQLNKLNSHIESIYSDSVTHVVVSDSFYKWMKENKNEFSKGFEHWSSICPANKKHEAYKIAIRLCSGELKIWEAKKVTSWIDFLKIKRTDYLSKVIPAKRNLDKQISDSSRKMKTHLHIKNVEEKEINFPLPPLKSLNVENQTTIPKQQKLLADDLDAIKLDVSTNTISDDKVQFTSQMDQLMQDNMELKRMLALLCYENRFTKETQLINDFFIPVFKYLSRSHEVDNIKDTMTSYLSDNHLETHFLSLVLAIMSELGCSHPLAVRLIENVIHANNSRINTDVYKFKTFNEACQAGGVDCDPDATNFPVQFNVFKTEFDSLKLRVLTSEPMVQNRTINKL